MTSQGKDARAPEQGAGHWWPTRWERLPQWLQQELEAVATQWAAGQGDQERVPS